jgi:hypothetical protein
MVLSNSQWLANPGVTYEIDQSIRFNDDDSAYLSRTPGSAGNRRTWTFSCWVKRANITGANCPIFTAGGDEWLMFLSGNTLGFNQDGTNNYRIVTTQLFRDPGAWMHVVLRVDTTNATAGDRFRLYINGSEVTDFGTDTNPPLNYDTAMNNTVEHNIGKLIGSSAFFDGYLAEINHIDGSSLAPGSFGETNEDTGQWVPKKYSGSYGTNGFYIDGRDSSDLGDDESGNGNDYASNNLAAADQVTDSPTNNHCTLNSIKQDQTGLSNGNLQFTTSSTSTHKMASATIAQTSGKWYCEVTCNATLGSNARIGIIPEDNVNFTGSNAHVGDDANSFAYVDNGQKESNNSQSSYGASYANGDVIAMALNLDDNEITFYKDGSSQGAISITANTEYRFAASQYNAGGMLFNFGQAAFAATPPTGFKALTKENLPDPTIADPSAYFQSTTYTGNGSTQSITNAGNSDLQPDLIWIRNRDATDGNVLTDAVRGATKILATDSTGAESTDADTVTAFASDGFALGDDDKVNTNTENYVAWQWKADSAWSEDATGNILASSGRRNTTAGFSICSWTHQTSGNYAIKHGLSTTPEFLMTKSRDNTVNWDTWHQDLADTAKRILVNTTGAEITAYWVNASDSADGSGAYTDIQSGESPVTASLFGFQHDNFAATDDIIGYFWTGIEGYSSFGKYVGNGSSTAAPFVYTGFRPALVVTKNISNSGDAWPVADAARSPFNVANATVFWNQTTAETTGYAIDLLSNGFRPASADHSVNESGATIIYAAWAESPFKTANAR